MESLPQEIIDKIAAHVHGDQHDFSPSCHRHSTNSSQADADSRAALACISRRWQYAFERQAFRSLQVKNTELEDFDAIIQAERRNHVQILALIVILPPYPEDSAHLFEQSSDRDANDEAFSSSFHHLFRILSTWGPRDTRGSALNLYLEDIKSPSDPDPELETPDVMDRHIYSYIHLRRGGDLPLVPIISGFDIRMQPWPLQRRLAPETGLQLLARMPAVRSAIMTLADTENRYPAIRRRNRDGLASVLRSESLPRSLVESLGLHIGSHAGSNQTWRPTNLLTLEGQPDPVSCAIWEASSELNGLRQLRIEGCIDPSLLWPGPLTTSAFSSSLAVPAPFWQNITNMAIIFDPRTPSGEWYFRAPDGIDILNIPFLRPTQLDAEDGAFVDRDVLETEMPPGYDLSEPHEAVARRDFDYDSYLLNSGEEPVWVFRLVPEDRLLLPLIEAWARALSQMPQVRRAVLRTTLRLPYVRRGSDHHYDWSLRYLSPCQCSICSIGFVREGERETRCSGRIIRGLSFRTLTWRPEGALLGVLRGMGSRYHDGGMEEWYHDASSVLQDLGL